MVKGITRRVVIIKSPDPDIFEEAIFLVKEEAFSKGVSKADVLKQARLAASEYVSSTSEGKKKRSLPPWAFALAGAAATAMIWLLTALI